MTCPLYSFHITDDTDETILKDDNTGQEVGRFSNAMADTVDCITGAIQLIAKYEHDVSGEPIDSILAGVADRLNLLYGRTS